MRTPVASTSSRRSLLLGVAAALAAAGVAAPARAQGQPPGNTTPGSTPPPPQAPPPQVKALGDERYQVGRIVVDKRARRFTVPGKVLVVGKPLEYLITAPQGMKAYEALFEADTTGMAFNLACILIGLEADAKAVPWRQYRQVPKLVGPALAISVAWTDGGQRRELGAAQALLNPEAETRPDGVEWVYTGAPASEFHQRFIAEDTGTLVGFVHDPNTIVESAAPIGLGAYGTVRGNAALLPPVGTPVELIVAVRPAAR